MNIRSLGFWDIRECMTLWRLISWSLGCMTIQTRFLEETLTPMQKGYTPYTLEPM